jgi:hypothetical protein
VTAADDPPSRRAARIVRAFNAAFRRLCEAKSVEDAEDELSNLLCQLYRLGELVRATRAPTPPSTVRSKAPSKAERRMPRCGHGSSTPITL